MSAQNSSEVGGRKAEGEGRKEEVEEAADAGLASQMIKASRMLEFCGEIVGMQIEDTDADGTEIIGKLPGIHAGHRGSLNEGQPAQFEEPGGQQVAKITRRFLRGKSGGSEPLFIDRDGDGRHGKEITGERWFGQAGTGESRREAVMARV